MVRAKSARIFSELLRRNVLRFGVLYAVVGWLLLQIVDALVSLTGLPEWLYGVAVFLVLVGLPLVLLFAWTFELTPEGIVLERNVEPEASITERTGKRLDGLTTLLLIVAILVHLVRRFLI